MRPGLAVLAALLLLAPGERAAVTSDLAQEMTASPPGREGKQLVSVLSRQQVRLQRAMNVHGLGVLPWPKALGSTPWSVARQMTEIVRTCTLGGGRRRYTVRWVSDHGPAWGSEVASIREVLAGGLPVILVTGGPLVLDDVHLELRPGTVTAVVGGVSDGTVWLPECSAGSTVHQTLGAGHGSQVTVTHAAEVLR